MSIGENCTQIRSEILEFIADRRGDGLCFIICSDYVRNLRNETSSL